MGALDLSLFSASLPVPGLRARFEGAAATDPEATREAARETAWIRAARGGDTDAFRRLVEAHQNAAYETALRILRSPEAAEEAAQDAFVRAWRALPGFREEARFSTWLYRIVTRCALDGVRAATRRRRFETGTEPAVLEERPAPAAIGLPISDRLRLHRALAELDPTRRAVVTLFYLGEQTIEEIAGTLGLPSGTVKSHLHRSRRILRRAWVRDAGGGVIRGGPA